MRPYLGRALAAEQIRDWQREAERSQRARQARRGRPGRMPSTGRLSRLRGRTVTPGRLVAGQRHIA